VRISPSGVCVCVCVLLQGLRRPPIRAVCECIGVQTRLPINICSVLATSSFRRLRSHKRGGPHAAGGWRRRRDSAVLSRCCSVRVSSRVVQSVAMRIEEASSCELPPPGTGLACEVTKQTHWASYALSCTSPDREGTCVIPRGLKMSASASAYKPTATALTHTHTHTRAALSLPRCRRSACGDALTARY